MITNILLAFLSALLSVALYPLTFLPDVTLPSSIASAISSAGAYIATIDAIFPVSTLLSVLASFLAVETAIFVYKLIRWTYQKIPGVN